MIDGDSLTAQLCASGMAIEGDPEAAYALFLRAWESRRDDYEASIAAHFLARHQPTPADTLRWNQLAVAHALAVSDERAKPFLASLYLNLGDSLLTLGRIDGASAAASLGRAALEYLVQDGYRTFVARGLDTLSTRISHAVAAPSGE